MQSNQGEHQSLQILDEVIEDPQTLWVLGFGDIDEGANLGGLRSGALVSYLYLEGAQRDIPRKICVHCPTGSPTPVVHPYSSEATCYHLPYPIVSPPSPTKCPRETYFIISLVLMIRLISSTIRELTHTVEYVN